MSLLVRTKHYTYCPYKGDCTYYSIPIGGSKSEYAVWTYEKPSPPVEVPASIQLTCRLFFRRFVLNDVPMLDKGFRVECARYPRQSSSQEHRNRTILPATVTRTLPSAGKIVMGWSGPGILISLPLLVLVSI